MGIYSVKLGIDRGATDTRRRLVLNVLANDRHAAVFFRGHATRQGRTLDNPTCLRIRFDGGQVVEVWEFVWDLEHVESFWARTEI